MGLWQGIKRGSKALIEGPGPGKFVTAAKIVNCQHCGHDTFIEGLVVLNTVAKSHPAVDFGKSVTSLACDEFGHIEWFAVPPERQ